MMTTTPEIELLLDRCVLFVLTYRQGKAFVDWTEEEIRNTLRDCCLNRAMLYYTNEKDEILGIVHGIADQNKRVFHVTNCLTIDKKALPLFVRSFDMMFPSYTLHGQRFDKLKVYNTPRFQKKFLAKLRN